MTVAGLAPAGVLFGFGAFLIATGLFYGLPLPVQPMKAVSAVILTDGLRPGEVAAAGMMLGVVLLVLGITGWIGRLARAIPQSGSAGLQKKIDVMIAVDMLTHTFRRNMHQATLLTSDLDFKPLLDALVHEGMFVTLWYPPNDTNKELVAAADRRQPFGIRDVGAALTDTSKHLITIPHHRSMEARGWPYSGSFLRGRRVHDCIYVEQQAAQSSG